MQWRNSKLRKVGLLQRSRGEREKFIMKCFAPLALFIGASTAHSIVKQLKIDGTV
jgi:hypothetical protein